MIAPGGKATCPLASEGAGGTCPLASEGAGASSSNDKCPSASAAAAVAPSASAAAAAAEADFGFCSVGSGFCGGGSFCFRPEMIKLSRDGSGLLTSHQDHTNAYPHKACECGRQDS